MDTSAILLVDDEPVAREAMVSLLLHAGYQVFETYNGAHALQLLDQHPEITHLLSDVYMAGMSGVELAQEAHKRRPDLQVILTSGHQVEPRADYGFLQKPWRLNELRALISAQSASSSFSGKGKDRERRR